MSSDAFQWNSDYDDVLKQIAETDAFDVKWDLLKNIIKSKIEQNISMFLRTASPPSPPPSFNPVQLQNGGVRLPPFPPRTQSSINVIGAPQSYLNEEQANVLRESIFAQLDFFDSDPPFTIQRLCELCINPKQHYKSVGKYLRAVEKSTLVTSTWAEYPPLTENEKDVNIRSIIYSAGSEPRSIPNTPLFSPIPFLHDNARARSRSKSHSPPPSPLALSSAGPASGGHPETLSLSEPGPQALGLVDELDDPRPGHMSEHPTALTAVTTVMGEGNGKDGGPIVQSLESRFIKAEAEAGEGIGEGAMAVDENKENEN
ncbi:hypothetical protein GYMLUDRAFT_74279 [Collybiopsis luxurians FD-317 M1]|uniref:PPP4R2-domain-containing protein n=1 Tax=Collybiopsis luxurians FD-317 M1 TaxID=944289 RepID=A0A0D0B8D2_9AGAR|nr:hypothetical protein GYMLUDRAFT_74279 [Collybiopsis luxurians FD-317 M1]